MSMIHPALIRRRAILWRARPTPRERHHPRPSPVTVSTSRRPSVPSVRSPLRRDASHDGWPAAVPVSTATHLCLQSRPYVCLCLTPPLALSRLALLPAKRRPRRLSPLPPPPLASPAWPMTQAHPAPTPTSTPLHPRPFLPRLRLPLPSHSPVSPSLPNLSPSPVSPCLCPSLCLCVYACVCLCVYTCMFLFIF